MEEVSQVFFESTSGDTHKWVAGRRQLTDYAFVVPPGRNFDVIFDLKIGTSGPRMAGAGSHFRHDIYREIPSGPVQEGKDCTWVSYDSSSDIGIRLRHETRLKR